MQWSRLHRLLLSGVMIVFLALFALPALAQTNPISTPSGGSRGGSREPVTVPQTEDEIDMEDWILLEGDGVTIMVPPEFEGNAEDRISREDLLTILDTADLVMGDEFDWVIDSARENPIPYILLAYAPDMLGSRVLTNLIIIRIPLEQSISLQSILQVQPSSFPEIIQVSETGVMALGDYDQVGRAIFDMEIMGLTKRFVAYFYQVDGYLYGVSFDVVKAKFEELAPAFEQMASTFEVTGE